MSARPPDPVAPGADLEVELKLALPPAQAERLRRHPALRPISPHRAVISELDAIYFDTPDLALKQAGVAVRLRESAGQWVQTVKGRGDSQGALHRRLEWETPSEGAGLDFSGVDDPALRRLLNAPGMSERLQPVFRTRFRRWARLLELGDGTRIELALDEGRIETGERHSPICEIELELKAGRPEALFDLALSLLDPLSLVPEPRSKAERGYRLHAGVLERPLRAGAPQLDPRQSPAAACAAFLGAGIDQFQRNLAGAIAGSEVEFLHQARVALRRLRASLSVFRPVLPAEAADLAAELRWLMGETGPARDWDVFCGDTLPAVARATPAHPGLDWLATTAATQRAAAQARAAAALDSARTVRLLLELGRLAVQLARPQAPAGSAPASLRAFARRRLRRRAERALLGREALAALDDGGRHDWRISLKKLRYAAEFLAPALARRGGGKRWIAALSSLQDILGSLNDAATTHQLLAALPADSPAAEAGRALVHGYVAGAAHARLEQLELARRQLANTTPPWKT